MNRFVGVFKEIRIHQWYKQLIILIPLVFSQQIFELYSWIDILLCFISFSIVCGSVYIFNDINDIEEDRSHPIKKNRPIASGELGVYESLIYASLLMLLGLLISFYLDKLFTVIIIVYLIQNILYSIKLKDIIILDLIIVAFGILLRLVSGYVILGQNIDMWISGLVFITGFMLVVGKRKRELEEFSSKRKSLNKYNIDYLDRLFSLSYSSLLALYIVYILSFNPRLSFTIVFAIYSISRYIYLIENEFIDDQPRKILKDKIFTANLIIWTISLIVGTHILKITTILGLNI
jgi:4-hydroxybenzoate polyprenyltransferase